MECMLCFEEVVDRSACETCGKEWCLACDYRWRLAQHNASLAPTCPFCRKELRRMFPEPSVPLPVDSTADFFDRLMTKIIQLIAYVLLSMVLLLLPLVENYLNQSAELFLAYFCLILFVFVFLCCQYINRHCPLSDPDDDEERTAVLSRA